ncbi:MAG: CAP domain-containing protein, partial [Gammaproteobacteria bacterium]
MRTARLGLVVALAALGLWLLGSDRAWAQAAEEGCFTASANEARAAEGIAPMSTNQDLVGLARRHSAEMAASGTIFHNNNLGSDVPGKWTLVGENVGQGPACASVHTAFMNSPAHRKNIMEPRYNFVGMGVVVASGTVFVTEVFMERKTAAAAPPPAAAAPAPPPAPKPPAPPVPKAPAPSPTVKAARPVTAPNPATTPAVPLPPPAGTPPASPPAAGPTGQATSGGSE